MVRVVAGTPLRLRKTTTEDRHVSRHIGERPVAEGGLAFRPAAAARGQAHVHQLVAIRHRACRARISLLWPFLGLGSHYGVTTSTPASTDHIRSRFKRRCCGSSC
jgi:hypothetical protein